MALLPLFLAVLVSPAIAAEKKATTTINKTTYLAPTLSAEQSMRFKKVFLFPTVDDVGGVIAAGLDDKLAQVLSKGGRFDLVRDNAVIKALSPDESTYIKVAQNPAIHKEAAQVTGADTTALLRTKNIGNEAQMTLEFRDAQGDLLFSETASLPGFSSMEARGTVLENMSETILKKLPFEGVVSGRTMNTITIDMGMNRAHVGDELDLVKVVSLQRHPLLKTIVNVDYVRVGKARVSNVDRFLSFAEITEENPGERINTNTKILSLRQVYAQSEGPVGVEPSNDSGRQKARQKKKEEDEFLKGDMDRARARYGYAGISLNYGSITQTQNNGTASSSEFGGSGIGAKLEGELWVTKNWIVGGDYDFQNANLSGPTIKGISSSLKKFDLVGGYRIYPNVLDDRLSVTACLGIQTLNFDIPTSTVAALGGKKFTGPLIRLNGELQFSAKQKIAGGLEFQPISSFTDIGGALGTPDGGTAIGINIGYHYLMSDNFWIRAQLSYDSANGNYPTSSSVNDRRFAIGPGILYFF